MAKHFLIVMIGMGLFEIKPGFLTRFLQYDSELLKID